jgi:hypothetical protein
MISLNALVAHDNMPTIKNNCVSARIITDNAKLIICYINTLTLEKLNL